MGNKSSLVATTLPKSKTLARIGPCGNYTMTDTFRLRHAIDEPDAKWSDLTELHFYMREGAPLATIPSMDHLVGVTFCRKRHGNVFVNDLTLEERTNLMHNLQHCHRWAFEPLALTSRWMREDISGEGHDVEELCRPPTVH